MTDDASARRDDAAEQADDRFVEALLEASKPEEAAASEARIRRGMAAIRGAEPVAEVNMALPRRTRVMLT